MKRVRVFGNRIDVEVLVDWDNILHQDCKELNLKKGDSLEIFYRDTKGHYKYETIPVYTKPYHPAEKLAYLLNKQPNVQKLIDEFDLVLSV